MVHTQPTSTGDLRIKTANFYHWNTQSKRSGVNMAVIDNQDSVETALFWRAEYGKACFRRSVTWLVWQKWYLLFWLPMLSLFSFHAKTNKLDIKSHWACTACCGVAWGSQYTCEHLMLHLLWSCWTPPPTSPIHIHHTPYSISMLQWIRECADSVWLASLSCDEHGRVRPHRLLEGLVVVGCAAAQKPCSCRLHIPTPSRKCEHRLSALFIPVVGYKMILYRKTNKQKNKFIPSSTLLRMN